MEKKKGLIHIQKALKAGKITQAKFIGITPGIKRCKKGWKKSDFEQKTKKIKISTLDIDKDGIPNFKDCSPLDPTKQDFSKTPRYFKEHNIDDYYFTGTEYRLIPGARKKKKGLLG